MGEVSLGAAVGSERAFWESSGWAVDPAGDFRRPSALNLRGGWLCQRAGGPAFGR